MMNMRIVFSKATVNGLVTALQQAYTAGDSKMVRCISTLLGLSQGQAVGAVADRQGVSRTTVYDWLKAFRVEGVTGLKPKWKGGVVRN